MGVRGRSELDLEVQGLERAAEGSVVAALRAAQEGVAGRVVDEAELLVTAGGGFLVRSGSENGGASEEREHG
jgi:hypothetical protein